MRNTLLKTVFIYFATFSFLFSQPLPDTSVSDISLKTFVEEESVPLNREVRYIVQLSWIGELDRYQISEILDPDVTNLMIRGSGSSNKVVRDKTNNTLSIKKITFYFKPIELGMAYINGVTVRYKDTLLDKSESLLASRISVRIIDPIPDKNNDSYFQYLIYLLIVAILFFSIYLYLIYQKRRKENALLEADKIQESAEEKYTRMLKEVFDMPNANYRERLNNIHRIILGYFSEKYQSTFANKSSEEILHVLKENKLDENQFNKFKEFIEKADLIRFAGNKVNESEFHQLYASIEAILEKSHSENSQKEDK
jgi:hypothetical protein